MDSSSSFGLAVAGESEKRTDLGELVEPVAGRLRKEDEVGTEGRLLEA